mmetsp:Transcript_59142/g.105546  ORF Transcript_59142/g.105546 Transcript_59142/m.105546 type:complete len:207 (+) Transcript_59142:306-926(+)
MASGHVTECMHAQVLGWSSLPTTTSSLLFPLAPDHRAKLPPPGHNLLSLPLATHEGTMYSVAILHMRSLTCKVEPDQGVQHVPTTCDLAVQGLVPRHRKGHHIIVALPGSCGDVAVAATAEGLFGPPCDLIVQRGHVLVAEHLLQHTSNICQCGHVVPLLNLRDEGWSHPCTQDVGDANGMEVCKRVLTCNRAEEVRLGGPEYLGE